MRTFLRIIFVFLFVNLSPLFILLLSANRRGYSPGSITQQLTEGNVFSELDRETDTFIDQMINKDESDGPLKIVGPMLKTEITAELFKAKVEALIDDTAFWLTGRTTNAPVISLQEVKERILQKNPALVQELLKLSRELKKQEVQDTNAPPLPDFAKLIESDFSYPVGKYMGWLKIWYTLATKGVVALAVVLVLLLTGIVILSPTKTSRLRFLGVTFLGTALWNLPPVLIAGSASFLVTKILITKASGVPSFLLPLFDALIHPLLVTFTRIGAIAIGILFFASTAGFIAASQSTKSTVKINR